LKIFWEDQKIAAFGSAYRDVIHVGAAEGCDLLILPQRRIIRRPNT
jgi:hypothetical protein